jgi:phage baseplate assembly protein V
MREIRGYGLLRFGNVCDVDAERGYVRVELDEDGITTHWLPVVVAGTKADKYFSMPAVNEQVVCLMDENCEEGVVIGALYSSVDTPTGFGEGKAGVVFEDGSKVVYDKDSKTLTIKTEAKIVIEATTSISIKNASQSIKTILSDLIDAILEETHGTGTGPSTPPINAAQYTAIQERINQLFE